MAIGDPRGMDAEGNGGYINPFEDWAAMLWKAGPVGIVGVDIAYGGGELVSSMFGFGETVVSGVGDTLGSSGLFG